MGFGIGCGFSLSMALPVDVAHDGASVAATTGLMLLVAYLIAAASPVGLGAIRDLTGSYAAVMWVLVGHGGGGRRPRRDALAALDPQGARELGRAVSDDGVGTMLRGRDVPASRVTTNGGDSGHCTGARAALGRRRPRLGRAGRARAGSLLRGRARRARRSQSGTRLLDAGCGAGLALVLAARRGATVTGLDASAGPAGGRARAPAGGRPARGRSRGAALRGRLLRRGHRVQLRAVRGRSDGGAARDQSGSRGPVRAWRSRPGAGPSSARCGRCWAPSARCSRRLRRAPAARSRWPRPARSRRSSRAPA